MTAVVTVYSIKSISKVATLQVFFLTSAITGLQKPYDLSYRSSEIRSNSSK